MCFAPFTLRLLTPTLSSFREEREAESFKVVHTIANNTPIGHVKAGLRAGLQPFGERWIAVL
jgi:hypothetical protein